MNWPWSKPKLATPKFRIVQSAFEIWSEDDVSKLRLFFSTATGKKLVSICGSEIFQQGLKECAGDTGAPKAHGMDYLLRFQFNLASDEELKRISRESLDKDSNSDASQQDEAETSAVRSF